MEIPTVFVCSACTLFSSKFRVFGFVSFSHYCYWQVVVELRPGAFLLFNRSNSPFAHCYWAVSSPLDKWQNSELHKTVCTG
jgi:hypothetical protein